MIITSILSAIATVAFGNAMNRPVEVKPVDYVQTCTVVETSYDGYEWDVSIEDEHGNIWGFIDRENFWEVGMKDNFWFNDNATPDDFTDDEMQGLYHETREEVITVTERYYNGEEWLVFAEGEDGNIWCIDGVPYEAGDKLRVTFDDCGTPDFADDDELLTVEKI